MAELVVHLFVPMQEHEGHFATAETTEQDAVPTLAHIPGNVCAKDVPGQGTPQDFSSTVCNPGSPVGELQRSCRLPACTHMALWILCMTCRDTIQALSEWSPLFLIPYQIKT